MSVAPNAIDRSIQSLPGQANPILTEISDSMTAEGRALDAGDAGAAERWARRKEAANRALAECSHKYNGLMGELREAGW